uniref:Peptidase_S9 domain-containing protein n=1 Tax=Macrostomum lignano TaxID=282301 RepID=A0A1I8FE56_9PLAT
EGQPPHHQPCQAADAQQSACSYPELRVNRDLLDSKFEGYKLALEQPASWELKLPRPRGQNPQLTERQYSFDHLKAYGVQNHLYLDPSATVVRPVSAFHGLCDETAACVALPMRAAGRLFLVDTRWRAQLRGLWLMRMQANPSSSIHFDSESNIDNKDWEACATFETEPSLLVYARRYSATNQLHCLLMRVCESSADANKSTNDDKSSDGFRCVLDWFTYQSHGNYQQIRRLTLESSCVPNYACFDAECRHLLLECDRPFEFVDKDDKNTSKTTAPSSGNEAALNPSGGRQLRLDGVGIGAVAYTWSQSQEDGISVFIPLPTGVGKADIEVEPHSECRLLELHLLGKRSSETPWPCLVTNDARGAELPDAATAAAAAPLWPELEDCDLPEAGGDGDGGLETGALVWIDGEAKRVWLFATRVTPSEPPYVCLRRDVDGLLWRPDFSGGDASSIWQHVTTFHAFGYVRASKTDAKFVSCAPSFGYAAICDCYRHVYVYHSPGLLTLCCGIVSPVESSPNAQLNSSGPITENSLLDAVTSLRFTDSSRAGA